jgi:predicted DNA-binding transcriptional regulator AlpA
VKTTDYLTMTEVAETTGLAYETIRKYRREHRMPEPEIIFGKPVWKRTAITKWLDSKRSA